MPPNEAVDLSVIVVNWNTRERLRDCLTSVDQHLAPIRHEVIVVDNASEDGSSEMVSRNFPHVELARNGENVGFGRANNQAMRMAKGNWFLLLNSDTTLVDSSVAGLFERVRDTTEIGVAHCRLILGDGRLQHSAYRFTSVRLAALEDLGLYKLVSRRRAGETLLGGYWDYARERDVDWVSGAFMLVPRRVFEVTGGFDERLFMYGEDMEWCQRIQASDWRVRYYPEASVKHFDHSSSNLRWGDERITICLHRQLGLYREQNGAARAAVLLSLRIVGSTLRTTYYSFRILGPRGDSYLPMRRYTMHALRVLVTLAVSRGRPCTPC